MPTSLSLTTTVGSCSKRLRLLRLSNESSDSKARFLLLSSLKLLESKFPILVDVIKKKAFWMNKLFFFFPFLQWLAPFCLSLGLKTLDATQVCDKILPWAKCATTKQHNKRAGWCCILQAKLYIACISQIKPLYVQNQSRISHLKQPLKEYEISGVVIDSDIDLVLSQQHFDMQL